MLKILLMILMFGQNTAPKNLDPNAWITTYQAGDVKFSLPPQLTFFDALEAGRIVIFTNFDGQYYHGGIIPEGGMEVVIRFRKKNDGGSIEKLIGEETRFSKIVSKSTIDFGDQSATKIMYENDYVIFREIITTVYFERNNKIYEFLSDIHKEDSENKELTGIFEKLLDSVSFAK